MSNLKVLATFIFVNLVSFNVFSQSVNYIPKYVAPLGVLGNSEIYQNGLNVGIGSTNASEKLVVTGNVKASSFIDIDNTAYYCNPSFESKILNVKSNIFYDLDNINYFCNPGSESKLEIVNSRIYKDLDNANYFIDPSNETTSMSLAGNVGIGFLSPSEKLVVNGNIKAEKLIDLSKPEYICNPGDQSILHSFKIMEDVSGVTKFSVANNGTTYINATLNAKVIFVKTDVWSDFVFESDYKLMSLRELENFINENNHLPNVPSENEVTENGFSLGDMDALLLQKIEELTLYIIEQQKLIDKMKSQIDDVSNRIE